MNAELHATVDRARAACRQQNTELLARITELLEDVTSDLILMERGQRPEVATGLREASARLAGICEGLTRPHLESRGEQVDELLRLMTEDGDGS